LETQRGVPWKVKHTSSKCYGLEWMGFVRKAVDLLREQGESKVSAVDAVHDAAQDTGSGS
jgi:hypothetical protein